MSDSGGQPGWSHTEHTADRVGIFDRDREDGFTIRWRRGDRVAYVLSGQRVGDQGMTDVLDTIPVLPAGWTDLAKIWSLRRRRVRHREQDTPP